VPNDTDADRLGAKTARATVVDLNAYRNASKMTTVSTPLVASFAGIGWLLVAAVVLYFWMRR
jgi:hypothetical protein